jgi:hypothetical protein
VIVARQKEQNPELRSLSDPSRFSHRSRREKVAPGHLPQTMGEAQKSPTMKKTRENQRERWTLANAVGTNGKLDKETLDRSLDRMLKAADEINRELDELLAKARS